MLELSLLLKSFFDSLASFGGGFSSWWDVIGGA